MPSADIAGSSSTKRSTRVDEDLLDRLELAGLEVDHVLCSGINPTLQLIYKRWTIANNLISEVEKMVNQG